MPLQNVSSELLKSFNKVLFIAPLAIGDFSYLQNCLRAFSNAFPHIEIHLWVDELRRTNDAKQWPHLEKYSLYDWLENCEFIQKVYRRTYSPQLFQESVHEAQSEHYPLVVSLSNLRPHQYAVLARKLSPRGFIAGIKNPVNIFKLHRLLAYNKLNTSIPANRYVQQHPHISAIYADWFFQLFGIENTEKDRAPFVNIPEQWLLQARQQLDTWGVKKQSNKVVFVNSFAKVNKRCWPLQKVAELIKTMQKQEKWKEAVFIVNAPPEKVVQSTELLAKYKLKNTFYFSAEHNFFELPAMLSWCDLIISVETAVMHLANAVHVPVIVLMRQKNPEWAPFDTALSKIITTTKRRDWIDAITVDEVLKLV